MNLDAQYWDNRYVLNATGWDIGRCSKPMQYVINSLTNTELKILIPGCGNGYEANYLYKQGFHNTYILDWAAEPLAKFKANYPNFPNTHILHQNFFELEDTFDLILEQTFFCALSPNLRSNYVSKMHALLSNNGRLSGVLFNDTFGLDGPPFGGSVEEYLQWFEPIFSRLSIEPCLHSEPARMGREVWINAIK